MYIQFSKKGKEMKNTERHRLIDLSLLLTFSLVKWTSFYEIKGLQRSLNTNFRT